VSIRVPFFTRAAAALSRWENRAQQRATEHVSLEALSESAPPARCWALMHMRNRCANAPNNDGNGTSVRGQNHRPSRSRAVRALHEVKDPTGNDACDETKNSKPKTQNSTRCDGSAPLRLCVNPHPRLFNQPQPPNLPRMLSCTERPGASTASSSADDR
jgi:hypothetical protein